MNIQAPNKKLITKFILGHLVLAAYFYRLPIDGCIQFKFGRLKCGEEAVEFATWAFAILYSLSFIYYLWECKKDKNEPYSLSRIPVDETRFNRLSTEGRALVLRIFDFCAAYGVDWSQPETDTAKSRIITAATEIDEKFEHISDRPIILKDLLKIKGRTVGLEILVDPKGGVSRMRMI